MLYKVQNTGERVAQLTAAGAHYSLEKGQFFSIDLNPIEAERLAQALPVLSVTPTDSAEGGVPPTPIDNPKPALDTTPVLSVPISVDGSRYRSQVPFPRIFTDPTSANEPPVDKPGEVTIDPTMPTELHANTNTPIAANTDVVELAGVQTEGVVDDPNDMGVGAGAPGTKRGVVEHGEYHQEQTPPAGGLRQEGGARSSTQIQETAPGEGAGSQGEGATQSPSQGG